MTVPAHREKAHVLTLDSIRGIAAVTVVIHHVILMPTFLAAFPNRSWIDCAFFRSGGFLVDLFFVLSGIVMSLSYLQTDFGRFSLRDFMVRRFARVYPLHIVMLLVLLLFRLARIGLGLVMAGVVVTAPAAFEVNNGYSFFLNVFLLHSLGFVQYLNWNAPSWSISVEFYTYLVFGLMLLAAQRLNSLAWFYVGAVALAIGSWLILTLVIATPQLDVQFDWGLLRCFTSFFLGVLTVKAVEALPRDISPAFQGGIQLAAAVAAVAHVSLTEAYPWASYLAPVTFAVLLGSLLAFPKAAVVPATLTIRPLLWLGQRSYSIYMVHAFVVLLAEYFVRAAGKPAVDRLEAIHPGLAPTLNLLIVLGAVLALSQLTYRWIELPGSRLVRNMFRGAVAYSPAPAEPSTRLSS
ncbi:MULTISPECIES: acyltransferase [unclassified Bradyrhizobium]|uniref:acyltransferase family protein n=1 Tax=unclassified Bradyrhizobium TaxID=2631580 RepID=UPI0020B44114|nr:MULTISPECIES: acyltransferase [unclassified Bradyrhizobium]MCP3380868.1 acyltransferase [Bradyrhizobium sp. CCGUVB4N]MCP3441745.1 acyltransferase [Bradyrhizobium sp. CCGUVB14]